MGMGELMIIIVVIVISIGFFFALRNVALWYFKINDMIELLTQIRNNLRKLNSDGKDGVDKDC